MKFQPVVGGGATVAVSIISGAEELALAPALINPWVGGAFAVAGVALVVFCP